jgi:hypothetical protein
MDIERINKIENNDYSEMIKLLSVIEKAGKSPKVTIPEFNRNDTEDEDKFAISIWLLRDYAKNGLYEVRRKEVERDGKHEIDWRKTIETEQAYLNKKKTPFYMNIWTSKKNKDTQNMARRIHEAIIAEIVEQFSNNKILYSIFTKNISIQTNEKLNRLGNPNRLIKEVTKEISRQFDTEKKRMLTKLIGYIKKDTHSSSENIQSYGTSSFNLVWEDCLKHVFDDTQDKTVIEKPKWEVFSETGTISKDEADEMIEENSNDEISIITKEKSTLIPDVVHINDEKKEIIVIDAKYYIPTWPETKDEQLSGVPGIGDITKQYLYQLAYMKSSDYSCYKIEKNCFIMPMQCSKISDEKETLLRKKAKVDFPLFNHIIIESSGKTVASIVCFELNPNKCFYDYLSSPKGTFVDSLLDNWRS